jgi:hypothetical protein
VYLATKEEVGGGRNYVKRYFLVEIFEKREKEDLCICVAKILPGKQEINLI